jgi:hypothetical protein
MNMAYITAANIKGFIRQIEANPHADESKNDEIRLYRAVLKAIAGRACDDPHALAAVALEYRSSYDSPLRLEDWE